MEPQKKDSPPAQPPLIINTGSKSNLLLPLLGLATVVTGFIVVPKFLKKKDQAEAHSKADEDPYVNLATRIFSERKSWWTSDKVVVDFFKEMMKNPKLNDFKKLNAAYKKVSLGNDLLADMQKNLKADAYQEVLRIIGYSSGAVTPTSKQGDTVIKNPSVKKIAITKVDARLRKSPKALSAIRIGIKTNIITTVKAGQSFFVNTPDLIKRNGKLYFDTENNVFFIPVIVPDSSDSKKHYAAYIALSTVDVKEVKTNEDALPIIKKHPLQRITSMQWSLSSYIEGIGNVQKAASKENIKFNML